MSRKGFTLVEVMIVVLIIGVILAIAVPTFFRSRAEAIEKQCAESRRQIDQAKAAWIMQNGHDASTTPTMADLTPRYMTRTPVCPERGQYVIGDGATPCSCTFHGP